jgi:hypothetical protein
MNAKHVSASAIVLTLVSLSGCATIVTGANQGVMVESDPSGAACTVARDGTQLAAISTTPNTVIIGKGWSDLALDCKKEGHADSKTSAVSKFQPWALGNILIGGIIGFIVDGATGAITEYPKVVSLLLVPAEFPSEKERDAYFENKKATIEEESTRAIEAARRPFQTARGFPPTVDERCETAPCIAAVKPLEERKTQRLAALESQRGSTRVRQ